MEPMQVHLRIIMAVVIMCQLTILRASLLRAGSRVDAHRRSEVVVGAGNGGSVWMPSGSGE